MDLVDVKSRGDVKFKVSVSGISQEVAKHHGRYSKSDHLCQDGV